MAQRALTSDEFSCPHIIGWARSQIRDPRITIADDAGIQRNDDDCGLGAFVEVQVKGIDERINPSLWIWVSLDDLELEE